MNPDFIASLIVRCRVVATGALVGLLMAAGGVTASAHPMNPTADVEATATPVEDTASTNVPGCSNTGHQGTGVFSWTTIDGKRRSRTFVLQIPATYDETRPYSLNFVFHGAGGNSSQSYSWGLQNVSGASENGIFVFPDGINYENYGVGWDDTKNGYDLPFFDNMVKDIETWYCVDTKRVFVAGFSWGGDFVTSLICNRGNSIRAAAANSTTDEYNDKNNYLTYQQMPCSTTVHPAVRFGHAAGGDAEYPAPLFSTTSKLIQHFSSCASTSKAVSSSTTTMSCVSYNNCLAEVVDCSFNDSIGHNLPPNWAADTWAFFSTFK